MKNKRTAPRVWAGHTVPQPFQVGAWTVFPCADGYCISYCDGVTHGERYHYHDLESAVKAAQNTPRETS